MPAPLTFRPTYKFQAGTNLYEPRPDKKLRAPALCDRLLWHCPPDNAPKHLRQPYYDAGVERHPPDTKPLDSIFQVRLRSAVSYPPGRGRRGP